MIGPLLDAVKALEKLAKERIEIARTRELTDEQVTADQLKRYGVEMPRRGVEDGC
jgi:hypothetical protein